jgi:hypothetical protein
MDEWQFIYGDDLALNDRSELIIPIVFTSPLIIYDALANLSSNQVGTFLHSEFLAGLGWTVLHRYTAYRGKNLLLINDGFNQQYRLTFVPYNTRSSTVAFTLKLHKPTMPVYRSSIMAVGGSSTVTSTAVNATTIESDTDLQTLLEANSNRKGASICNKSTSTLYIDLGSTVSADDYTVSLGNGDVYEIPYGYVGIVTGIWSEVNGNAQVREFV